MLEPYTRRSPVPLPGKRVVVGQQAIQAASDAFLGWISLDGRDAYVRQLRDMKGAAEVEALSRVDARRATPAPAPRPWPAPTPAAAPDDDRRLPAARSARFETRGQRVRPRLRRSELRATTRSSVRRSSPGRFAVSGPQAKARLTDIGTIALIIGCGIAGPLLAGATGNLAPVVVGEIVAGVILGTSGTGTIDPSEPTLVLLSDIGFATLMFAVGMQVPLHDKRLRRSLGSGAVGAIACGVLAVPAGLAAAAVAGGGHAGAYAVILASSSAAIALPILEERGLTERSLPLIAQITIADIAAVIAVPFVLQPDRTGKVVLGSLAVVAATLAFFAAMRPAASHRLVPAPAKAIEGARMGPGPPRRPGGAAGPRLPRQGDRHEHPHRRLRRRPGGRARSAGPTGWRSRSAALVRASWCRSSSSCSGAARRRLARQRRGEPRAGRAPSSPSTWRSTRQPS